jgi:hypothetical protein
MRGLAVAILVIFAALIGCSSSSDIVLECKSPLIQKGEGCCMDADSSGVCDIDERPPAKPKQETKEEPKAEPAEEAAQQPVQEETEPQTEELMLNTQAEAEKTAKLFVEKWQAKQYSIMYTLFAPELKAKKTATEFTAIMELDPFYKRLTKVELGGVKMMGDNTAELGIKAYNNVQTIDIPGASLIFSEGSWKVKAFVDVFELPAFEAACTGYRNNNHYTTEDCAYDFSKKTRQDFCNQSGCHYVACLDFLGKHSGMRQQAEQCYMCQPVGKTVNQCILDIAIKQDKIAACDVIKEDRYSDKYCVCYGGYAKAKNNIGYCNMIQNEDNKYLCEKAFRGEYC